MIDSFEFNLPVLQRLCWLISQQWKAELAYSRATYRISYYRKLKAKLETSKKNSEKWNNHLELAKKIEYERLGALKKQEQLMLAKKKFRGPINSAKNKINAHLHYKDGKITHFTIPNPGAPYLRTWRIVEATEIEEMADQYEAEKVLNKALTDDKANS